MVLAARKGQHADDEVRAWKQQVLVLDAEIAWLRARTSDDDATESEAFLRALARRLQAALTMFPVVPVVGWHREAMAALHGHGQRLLSDRWNVPPTWAPMQGER